MDLQAVGDHIDQFLKCILVSLIFILKEQGDLYALDDHHGHINGRAYILNIQIPFIIPFFNDGRKLDMFKTFKIIHNILNEMVLFEKISLQGFMVINGRIQQLKTGKHIVGENGQGVFIALNDIQ